MADVRAVVLAAGRGVRMGGLRPKSLLPVGGAEPLMHYILRGLEAAGIDDLMVVTGFEGKELEDYVTEHKGAMNATFVFNARYASWGNFHSLRVALDASPGMDILAVNCDIVVVPEVFSRVLGTDGDLVLAVERRLTLDDEDMRVRLERDRVLGIGKDLKRAHGHGEFCGVSLLRTPAARAYLDAATDLEWASDTDAYYEDVYARIVAGMNARAAEVHAGEYAEVDRPEDVDAAQAVIDRHRDAWSTTAPASAQVGG